MVWALLCALLLSVLAPTVSFAFVANNQGGAGVIEVCTTDGPRWVSLESTDDSAQQSEGTTSDSVHPHCPFCLRPTDLGAAPPPHQPYLFLVQGGNQERPVWQAFFYFPVSNAYAPSPRGPPHTL